jgi:hypothetical protein
MELKLAELKAKEDEKTARNRERRQRKRSKKRTAGKTVVTETVNIDEDANDDANEDQEDVKEAIDKQAVFPVSKAQPAVRHSTGLKIIDEESF